VVDAIRDTQDLKQLRGTDRWRTMRCWSELEVLPDGQIREEVVRGTLVDVPDLVAAQPPEPAPRRTFDAHALDLQRAGGRVVHASEDPEHRRLAAARRRR